LLITPTKRNHSTVVFTILLLLAFSACLDQKRPIHSDVETTTFRQVTDEAGRSIAVPSHISRFISLAPNVTEIVYAINAGDRLVGNTTYCDYPAQAKQVEKVGDTLHPSIERIIALRPELVLVSTASQLETFTRQLEEHRIAVYVTDPRSLEDVFRSIAALGSLLNRNGSAQHVIDELRARAAAVEVAVKPSKPIKVFYQLSAEPLYTAGRDSFASDLIHRAGGESVTANVPGAWPKYSAESALAAQPDVIILPTGGSMGDTNGIVAAALQRSPAVMNGKVYKINADHLSRPGPRSVDGLEELARALHPEAFSQ
jgi:iron complex transport system substrate-binding protein